MKNNDKLQKEEKEWKTNVGIQNNGNKQKEIKNMTAINSTISIITLNINCPDVPIRKQRLSEWIKN